MSYYSFNDNPDYTGGIDRQYNELIIYYFCKAIDL